MPFMSMRAGFAIAASGDGTAAGFGRGAPTPCCSDVIGSMVMMCGMIILHVVSATLFAGTQRVALSPLFVHITYHETATPPPKI